MMPICANGEFPVAGAKVLPRVLVLDNEPLVRWALTTGLRLGGFDAESAADAAEACRLARRLPHPEVVLLDAGLWEANPWRLLGQLREISPECRFLILAVAGQEVALPPWDVVAVIRKPFDLHDVVRLVSEALTCAGSGDRHGR